MLIKSGRFLLILLLFLLSFGHLQTVQAAPDSVVTVGAATGHLSVKRKGARSASSLRSGQSLFVGDVVHTGSESKASLIFPDGAQVRLNSNSSLEIPAPRRVRNGNMSLFRVIAGQVWARLRPGNAVETRTAVLGVRGTEILVDVAQDGTTTLTVTDGSVDFSNEFGAVLVGQSQQSVARVGAAPTSPITVQNAGFIVEWTVDLDRAVIPREKFFFSLDRKTAEIEAARRAKLVQSRPEEASRHSNYGDALFDSGRYEEAALQYAAARRLEPQNANYMTRAGDALLEAGHLEAAQKSFLLALSENKGVAPPQSKLISLQVTEPSSWLSSISSLPAAAFVDKPAAAPALLGLASLALAHDRPLEAEKVAEIALTAEKNSSEAHLALGLSLLRQPGRLDEAISAFENALEDESTSYHYQAHAWLSLAYLGQDDRTTALSEAKRAVQMAPQSGLAHGNLALVYFYNGQSQKAKQEGQLALQLNPESVAARVALGQAALAQGDVDMANNVAAQAVALDPNLPQARYLLGISDAGRRDYGHAARELQEAVRLAPSFLLAHSALARVYNLMGRQDEATSLLTNLLPRHRQTDAVLGALGEIYYEQGLFLQSAASYREALQKNPNSALYQAELARTLLYSRRLNEAIEAGHAAIRLAPNVGQYHAILGQAYEFGNLPLQAEREFRTALTLDPQNALALAQLAYRHTGTDLRPAAAGFAQGFLIDPSISRQLLRGGTRLETIPTVSSQGESNFGLTHRAMGADGKFNAFGLLSRNSNDGNRSNADNAQLDVTEHLTFLPSPHTNIYATLRMTRENRGLPGANSTPDGDDRSAFNYGQAQLAVRQRFGQGHHLWAGLFGNTSRNTTTDSQLNSFFDTSTGLSIPQQKFTSRALEPEIRFDLALNRRPGRAGTLTFGAAKTRTRFRSDRDLQINPQTLGSGTFRQNNEGTLSYGQLTQQFGARFSLVAQLRMQNISRDSNSLISLGQAPSLRASSRQSRTHLLPSLLATYQPTKRSTLRLSLNQRITDVTASTFAPTETLISTESSSLPFGISENLRLAQLDAETYISRRGFLKLFLFQTRADNVQVGFSDLLGFGGGLPASQAPGLQIARWQGSGLGARYEHRINRHFYANLGAVIRRTTGLSGSAIATAFDNQTAPYEPKFLGNLGLNYLDVRGNKIGLRFRHTGAFFQDSPLALGRTRFGAQNYVDVLLAKEFSLQSELFLNVSNLFNKTQIQFNDFLAGQRRINFGLARRF